MSSDHLPAGAERLPPPTLDERHEINELLRAVRAYTHPVVFNARKQKLGTAVLLRHGERLFAFTAAHNIEDDTTIHFRMALISQQTTFGVLSTFIHPNYDPVPEVSKFDLAILELESNLAVTAGDVGQLYAGDFSMLPECENKIVSNAFVWVVGFPTELARVSDCRTIVTQTAFCTQIRDFTSDELSLHYPATAYQMPPDGMSCERGKTTETPMGYSGGGVWVTTNPPGTFFNPHEHIKLVGIQTHWSSGKRLVRCVPGKAIAESFKDFKPKLC